MCITFAQCTTLITQILYTVVPTNFNWQWKNTQSFVFKNWLDQPLQLLSASVFARPRSTFFLPPMQPGCNGAVCYCNDRDFCNSCNSLLRLHSALLVLAFFAKPQSLIVSLQHIQSLQVPHTFKRDSVTRFSTTFFVKKSQPGPHINRQKRFRELFHFSEYVRDCKTRKSRVRLVNDCADTMSAWAMTMLTHAFSRIYSRKQNIS